MAHNFNETTRTRTINLDSQFVLIGNNIDGSVNFDLHFFINFDDVKENLESILLNIQGEGEWDISLYQVNENIKMKYQYGYYKCPKFGKKILSYNYMNYPLKKILFRKKEILFLHSYFYFPDRLYVIHADAQKIELQVEIQKIVLRY